MKKQFTLFLASLSLLAGCTQGSSNENTQDKPTSSQTYTDRNNYVKHSCLDEKNGDIWYLYTEKNKENESFDNYGWKNCLNHEVMIVAQYPMVFNRYYDSKKDKGFAAFVVGEGVWYRDANGKKIIQAYTSNGPDDFSSGLARFVENDKIGFMDEELNKVIPAQFDWASLFENGEAKVCNGCELSSDGEHSMREGGVWGTVNQKGEIKWID